MAQTSTDKSDQSRRKPTVYASAGALAERFDASETSIWRWTREGDFPKPVKLTNGMTRWRMSDVIAWETKGAEDSGQTIPAE